MLISITSLSHLIHHHHHPPGRLQRLVGGGISFSLESLEICHIVLRHSVVLLYVKLIDRKLREFGNVSVETPTSGSYDMNVVSCKLSSR